MLFDTHCHLNFSVFNGKVREVIKRANGIGVANIVVPGTDLKTSKKAVEIADKYAGVYAAVGIHPHHVYPYNIKHVTCNTKEEIKKLTKLLNNKKVVAVGEIGLDQYVYKKTKYNHYKIDPEFIEAQKDYFIGQLRMAKQFNKSVIVHNRKAEAEVLKVLNNNWDDYFSFRMVFHCCEAEDELLDFAKRHNIFIGVDGDITYNKKKQEFVKKIPLDWLVIETDAPLLIPDPLRSNKNLNNEPKNLPLINKFIANRLSVDEKKLADITSNNAKRLFKINEF